MKTFVNKALAIALLSFALGSSTAHAFDSGSTGADGAFSPQVDTTLQLPPDGIFNFTTVNIPSGVTLRFARNTTNTPVTILASGNVTISGTINISGLASTNVGAAGGGNLGDDGLPGAGGPGGFDGGSGGAKQLVSVASRISGAGLGPGGGGGEQNVCGGGGGFAGNGVNGGFSSCRSVSGRGGQSYGNATLLPLIGGSGGGGAGFQLSAGSGGGGGAILIAASGTLTHTGAIRANGGTSGSSAGVNPGATGGGGSGGAVRLVATTLAGNGSITASGGGRGSNSSNGNRVGGVGSVGRIRLEAEIILRTSGTTPAFSFAGPQDLFVAGLPSLRITRVAGADAPAIPTGSADIILPETTPNPVTVEFATIGVPVGNTVELTVTPSTGTPVAAISGALAGTEANATASVSVNLPNGPSVLSAEVSFTVTLAMQEQFSPLTNGQQIARVKLSVDPKRGSLTTFITQSGEEFVWPSRVVAWNQ